MFLLLSLLACADPAPVALATCQAVPNLATDKAGLELFQPLLAEGDWKALSGATPTAGLELVGADGLAKIREQTTCTVLSTEGAGTGRWAVELERSNPGVNPDGSLGEAQTHTLSWQAVKTQDGIRIEAGIQGASISRRNAESAVADDDQRRAAAIWRAIHKKFPDPLLTVDIAKAEALYEKLEYQKKIPVKAVGVEDDKLFVEVSNTGDKPVSKLELRADFEVGDQTKSHTTTVPSLAPGAKLEVELPIPEGAEGNVHVEVVGLEL